jgi:hypothetical protein
MAQRPNSGHARPLFDVAELSFLDCAGARALVRARDYWPGGEQPVLRCPSWIVLRVLQLTGLDSQFTIEVAADRIPGVHRQILRLFASLDDTARHAARVGRSTEPDWILAARWDRIASLLDQHADAAEQFCYPAVFGDQPGKASEAEAARADLDGLRAAVARTRLHEAGSLAWWHAVRAARLATIDHIIRTERALALLREHPGAQPGQRPGRHGEDLSTYAAADHRRSAVACAGLELLRQLPRNPIGKVDKPHLRTWLSGLQACGPGRKAPPEGCLLLRL